MRSYTFDAATIARKLRRTSIVLFLVNMIGLAIFPYPWIMFFSITIIIVSLQLILIPFRRQAINELKQPDPSEGEP